ncbi:MAG TPA: type II toxin-antitoxin system prevent-host-death family antitoxin [Gemmatimonadaceae bacterium]|nr:type II toxin-antitoxin system prevent-host-death family antitoxin [Gemmatimonadaceae bacterium]
MRREVSLYEAKARLSALVRQVREGRTVVITVHGKPAAELRPVAEGEAAQSLAERLAELEADGLTAPAERSPRDYEALLRAAGVPRRRGAVRRFLSGRD